MNSSTPLSLLTLKTRRRLKSAACEAACLMLSMRVFVATITWFACMASTHPVSSDEPEARLQPYQLVRPHMGTRFTFTVFATSAKQAQTALDAANRRIAEIEQRMSDYRPDSEIRMLAKHALDAERITPLPISEDLRLVLSESRRIGKASRGAFDISIAPLSELWRASRSSKKMPDPKIHEAARALVGPQHWKLSDAGVAMDRGVKFDLGGIAKGFALDAALKSLKDAGLTRALIDGGGDLVAGDPPPDRDAWRIGVAPLEAGGEAEWVVPLVRSAVATSGDAWQFVEIDGKRYSHVLNPETGWGVEGRHSVTVLAPSATLADAWASAVCVLGPDAGQKALQAEPQAEAIVTTLVDGKPQQSMTEGFRKQAVKRKLNAPQPSEPERP